MHLDLRGRLRLRRRSGSGLCCSLFLGLLSPEVFLPLFLLLPPGFLRLALLVVLGAPLGEPRLPLLGFSLPKVCEVDLCGTM